MPQRRPGFDQFIARRKDCNDRLADEGERGVTSGGREKNVSGRQSAAAT
jgi:hypothetical protein